MNQIFKLKNKKLKEVESTVFNLEKDIQTIVENNTEELFDIKLIKSEFSVGGYRIDSLCFDEESSSFVIVEYKRDKSYSIVDQGYSYLSTMLNNKSDFVLELIENSELNIKKDQIDWSQSRIIFISTSFSSHQKNSVNFKDVPFEQTPLGYHQAQVRSGNYKGYSKGFKGSKGSGSKGSKGFGGSKGYKGSKGKGKFGGFKGKGKFV